MAVNNGYVFQALNAGVSGATAPNWDACAVGSTLVDGTITWKNIGQSSVQAAKLQTPHNIAGLAFDGTSDIAPTQSNIGDDGSFRRIAIGYVDTSNRPIQLHRASGGIDVSADLLTQQTEVTSHIGGQNVPTIDYLARVTGRTADRMTYLSGATVDSLRPAQALADVTSANQSASTATLSNHTQDDLNDGAIYYRNVAQASNMAALPVGNNRFQLGASGTNLPGWSSSLGTATWYFQGSNPAPVYGSQYLVMQIPPNATTQFPFLQSVTAAATCHPGDVVTAGGTLMGSNGGAAVIAATFYGASGYLGGANFRSSNGAWVTGSASAAAPAGTEFVYLICQGVSNPSTTGYASFNDAWCTINDVRVPNSAKAYGNLGDITPGGNNFKTAFSPTVNGATVSYTIPSPNEIDFTWTVGTVYWPDTTTSTISSGGLNFTGLTANTNYWFYIYVPISTMVPTFAGGANTSQSVANAAQMTQAGNLQICGVFQITTPSSGSGTSGGGGIGGCLERYERVLTDRGTVIARDVRVGDKLLTPDGWTPVLSVAHQAESDWYRIESAHRGCTVTPTQPFYFVDDTLIHAKDIRAGMVLRTQSGSEKILKAEHTPTESVKVIIGIKPPHVFFLTAGGFLVHNGTVKP